MERVIGVDMPNRCRLCTTNDIEGLIEEVAEAMWERHRERDLMGPWAEAGRHWHWTMRDFARFAVDTIRHRGHG